MKFYGWPFSILTTIILTIYVWALGCGGGRGPTPAFARRSMLTDKQVEGAYTATVNREEFSFVLLPNGTYRSHYDNYGCSDYQDWSGTWKLDATNSIIDIKEWPEGSVWYGDDSQAGKWFIQLRFDGKGKVVREGYICQYLMFSH